MKQLLRGGRWLDVRRGALVAGDLLLDGDRIAPAGEDLAGAEVVDCAGLVLVPGLIDLHVHPGMMDDGGENDGTGLSTERMRRDLRDWARAGVTTVVSLGLDRDFAFDLARKRDGGARMLTAGHGFGVEGGVPPFRMDPPGALRETDEPVLRRTLEEAQSRGAVAVKLWYDDWYGRFPKMAPAVARFVIAAAAELGMRSYAHVYKVEDARSLVEWGVRAFAHMPRDVAADRPFWDLVRERDVAVIPTLTVPFTSLEHLRDVPLERRREDMRCARENVAGAYRAGVRFGFGTDAGVSHRVVGAAEHSELALLVAAGISCADALRMATLGSAELLARDDLGELAPGRCADVVALRADPLVDIRAVRDIAHVWIEGVRT